MILVPALSPSLDVTYELDRLRLGAINRPRAVTRVAGGKSLNAARVAHAHGADVHVVAALGGRTGQVVADLLAADGVAATIVEIEAETRTCAALVEDGGGASSTDLYETASPLTEPEWRSFRKALTDAPQPEWVAVSGSLPPGVDPPDIVELLRGLLSRGARLAVDSSGQGLRALAPLADVVKINRHEVNELLERDDKDARTSARALQAALGCDVVVTDGARGGWAIVRDRELQVPAPSTTGRFSAGCGDAFLGALVAAMDAGVDEVTLINRARDAAERNAACPGQGILRPVA